MSASGGRRRHALAGIRGLFSGFVIALARPVGLYLARVFEGKPTSSIRVLRPLERGSIACLGVRRRAGDDAGGLPRLLPRVQRPGHGSCCLCCCSSSTGCPAAPTTVT